MKLLIYGRKDRAGVKPFKKSFCERMWRATKFEKSISTDRFYAVPSNALSTSVGLTWSSVVMARSRPPVACVLDHIPVNGVACSEHDLNIDCEELVLTAAGHRCHSKRIASS